jgi:arginyl-tRNA synthetase
MVSASVSPLANGKFMTSILSTLDAAARAAFISLGFPGEIAAVRESDRGDAPYQCNGAMAAAGIAKKRGEKLNPREIAAQAVAIMEADAAIGKLDIAGPGFINITPADDVLTARAKELLENPADGLKVETPKTIIVDYGGANVAKPMHVGHLRSAVLGEAIKRILRAAFKAITSLATSIWAIGVCRWVISFPNSLRNSQT